MSAPWPPPPDLASIAELVRAADPEGLLADGAPADEYEPEESALLAAIAPLASADLIVVNVMTRLEPIWCDAFSLDEEALAVRRPALLSLAKEIERFFGPESKPRTRAEILAENQG